VVRFSGGKSTIQSLAAENKVINFNSVAKAANVGKTWLYKESDIKEKILKYREHKDQKISNKQISSSAASKENILQMLRNRIKEIEAENRELKKQIEILYGQLRR
jgi:hypothetical protein